MPDQIQNTQRALDSAHAMIESASPAALSKPTPCEGWDGRALIEHMIGVVQNFTAAFGGATLTPPTSQGTAGLANENPAATYREIGRQLFISEETIRSHAKNILAKLEQPNRTQAVMAAVRLGLIQLD